MSANPPQQWFDKAAEDLIVARLVFKESHTAHTCFLAHQCIEKTLKAYLLFAANTYPRTHKLVDLLGLCQGEEPDLSEFLTYCTIVDQYYIPTRYPDGIPGGLPDGIPGEAEAKESIEAADAILQFVSKRTGMTYK